MGNKPYKPIPEYKEPESVLEYEYGIRFNVKTIITENIFVVVEYKNCTVYRISGGKKVLDGHAAGHIVQGTYKAVWDDGFRLYDGEGREVKKQGKFFIDEEKYLEYKVLFPDSKIPISNSDYHKNAESGTSPEMFREK